MDTPIALCHRNVRGFASQFSLELTASLPCRKVRESVETPDQFAPALEQALHSVRHDRRQALLNVMT